MTFDIPSRLISKNVYVTPFPLFLIFQWHIVQKDRNEDIENNESSKTKGENEVNRSPRIRNDDGVNHDLIPRITSDDLKH